MPDPVPRPRAGPCRWRPERHRRVPALLAAALLLAGWAAADGHGMPVPMRTAAAPGPAPHTTAPGTGTPGTGTPPYATLTVRRSTLSPGDALSQILLPVEAAAPASLSVAALDLTTGERAEYGVSQARTYDTASVVKLDVLAALLLRAQDTGRPLTAEQRSQATAMITKSDNKATDALWNAIGGAPGLDAANRRLGLARTTAGTDGLWGLTQTTAPDQLALLRAVFGAASPLGAEARNYAAGLLAAVEPDQRWGVSAAGGVTGLKNGWLPRSATGLWVVNSVGLVSAGGHQVLLAALSSGNADMAAGVSLVERAARAAVTSLGLDGS